MHKETFIARGMASVKSAISNASSHDEVFAGLEALLRHIVDGPTEADEVDMSGASQAPEATNDAVPTEAANDTSPTTPNAA